MSDEPQAAGENQGYTLCARCRHIMPQGAEVCSTCWYPCQVPQKICPTCTFPRVSKTCAICRKGLPRRAIYCTECRSYQDWRRHIPGSQVTLSLLAALFAVTASLFTAGSYYLDRDSDTELIVGGADKHLIYIVLSNTGRKAAILRADRCKLLFDGLPIPETDLLLSDANKDSNVIPFGQMKIAVTTPGFVANSTRTELEHLIDIGRTVTVQMEIIESNDRFKRFWILPPHAPHVRTETIRAWRIREFIMEKARTK